MLNLKTIESNIFNFDFDEIITNKNYFKEILRNEITEEIFSEYYDNLFERLENKSNISAGYVHFTEEVVKSSKNKIIIKDVTFEIGKIIFSNIKEIESALIIVCTIGSEIEKEIWKYFNSGNSLEGYILDKMASELVELSADYLQSLIEKEYSKLSISISNRYSPGYCGWSVSEQQKLFSLLPENFCGIKLTSTSLMIPIKSISGIIAVGKNISKLDYQCDICDDNFCYKKRAL